ncbi:LuxR C-terminal-related transcriptional regulator [Streptomyces sp. NPDC047022]|uniref:LuxR C-terminal-related transcriptional regulator n=1 Tax=Streptomyces sp. NPDC047022 TaxID=3155737 RepID=UPI0033F59872
MVAHRSTGTRSDTLTHQALSVIRNATGVPLAFGGVVAGDRQVRLAAFSGHTMGALRGVALDFGRGLGGKVAALRRPIALHDYLNASRISHDYDSVIAAEGLRAMVAVPVVVHHTSRAVLYAAIRESLPLGDRTIQAVTDAARVLEQELAVEEELARRCAWLNDRAQEPDTQRGDTQAEWETVRAAYAELRVLAQNVADSDLRAQISSVCERLAAVSPGSQDTRTPAPSPLSPRELDVLACVGLGQRNADIAADLGIGLETVKSHLRSAMRKLRCDSRLQAVVTARRYGLLP